MFGQLAFLVPLLFCTVLIAYQDFKDREISAWLIYGFVIILALNVFFTRGPYALLTNLITSLAFLLLWSLVILLYHYFKEKKFSNFIDSKLGLADILILFGIGLSTELVPFILFVSFAALATLILSIKFIKKNKSIPMAGIFTLLFIGFEGLRIVSNLLIT